jgi:hypothetical protein
MFTSFTFGRFVTLAHPELTNISAEEQNDISESHQNRYKPGTASHNYVPYAPMSPATPQCGEVRYR